MLLFPIDTQFPNCSPESEKQVEPFGSFSKSGDLNIDPSIL